jgi:HSP20 family protein
MTTLTRWQRPALTWPNFDNFGALTDELDRLFAVPFELSRGLRGWTPPMDVYEDENNYIVNLEVPGLKKEDFEISLKDGELTLSGERKNETRNEKEGTTHSERFFGRFQRTVTLPSPVDNAAVKANYTDGLLTITLPKTEAAKPKRIAVNVN